MKKTTHKLIKHFELDILEKNVEKTISKQQLLNNTH